MCCAMNTGTGRFFGSVARIAASAGGPPVDATSPMASTVCRLSPSTARAGRVLRRVMTGTSAISTAASATSFPNRRKSLGPFAPGLVMTSSAPSAIAFTDKSTSRASSAATTTMGTGCSPPINALMASSPDFFGI